MSPDAAGPGSPSEWMRHARSDLAIAKVERPADALLETLCFHAQQAAEKATKAVLLHLGIEVPRTHSIRALLDRLPEDLQLPAMVDEAAELTEYAVEARYPGATESVTDEEHARAIELAQAVVDWADALI
jgi:HEPN domain-containing protein